jgi:uncharacterized protein YhaN
MRLRRLDLTRYGHFTDYSLDFGPSKEGKSDLHVIFGPNEAGKTTAFEGYLDLLFGIPMQSPYNFLHEYDNMLVGGALDIDGATVEFTRIKKNRNDLLDIKGEPANPATLLHALSGMTREQYRAMFSLNDETIEAGGEDILESQGDLGELLFSAAAGLSDLGLVLDKARADVDAFHKLRAHKTRLGEAKKDIKRLDSEIKALDTNASTFKILLKSKGDAQVKYNEAKAEQCRLIHEKSRIEATLECLPLLPRLKEIKEALLELEDFSDVPDGWVDEVIALQRRSDQAQTDKKQASNSILRHNQKRDALKRAPSILESKESIELLLDAPKSRAQTADADLPVRRVDIEVLDTNIARGFKQLNYGDTTPVQVAEPLLLQMENLANEWTTAEQNLNTARTEQKIAKRKLERLDKDDESSEDDVDIDNDINQILDRIGPEALIGKLQKHDEAVQNANDEVTASIQDLFPWVGEVKELPKVELTEDQVKRLVDRWTSLQNDMEKAKEEFDGVTLKVNQLSARITEEENDESIISDKEARNIQSIRDESWNHHVTNMTSSTAEIFHKAMIHCDTVHDARFGMAERLARLREVQSNKVELEVSRNHFQKEMADIATDIAIEREIISAHLKALDLPKEFHVLDLPNWLNKLLTARVAVKALNKESIAFTKVKQEASCAEAILRDALSVGPESTLSELTRLARKSVAAVVLQSERKVTREKSIEETSTELQKRNDVIEELEGSLATVKEEWQKLASDLPISISTPSEFRAALPTLRDINAWLTKRRELARRIDAMDDDYSYFASEIKGYAGMVGEDAAADPLVLAKRLSTRLTDAELIEKRYNELSRDIKEDAEKEVDADRELVAIAEEVREKANYFPPSICVETIEDLGTAVANSKKATNLRSDRFELESRIITRLGATSIDTALELLSDEDVPGAQAQLESLEQDCSLAEKDLTQSIGDLRSASDKLQSVGGDDAVVRLEEERQTAFLTITDQAKQNLRLHLGVMAAERALARYRDKHRSSMLSDTAKAFQTLTTGRYSNLQTQPNGQKEILLALREDDKRSISVVDMSKGTRFQLYLALRLAGYHQFSSSGTTLPFIADDIMETFDNTRTSAALDLLQQMALSGQALYFTHHEHVVDLAREKCGDLVRIHNLVAD